MDIELDTIEYAHSDAAAGYSTTNDLDGMEYAMIGIGGLAVAGIGAAIYFAATAEPGEYQAPATNNSAPVEGDDGWDGPGVGMTYGGKMGIEVSPGLVIDSDGELGLGFGF